MQNLNRWIQIMGVAMCALLITPLFADPAPVYDADGVQQFDNGSNSDQPEDTEAKQATDNSSQSGYVSHNDADDRINEASMSMNDRMRRVEQQMANMQNTDMTARMSSLQDQLQALRNQIEELTHQLAQVQEQQKNLAQLRTSPAANPKPQRIEQAAQTPPPTPPQVVVPADQPNVAEEQQIYQTAYNQIKAKKYNDAVSTLQGMLKKYPSGQFAANAHYWLGELYGLMGKNDQALTEFNTVIRSYADSPRVSDAQLKVGLIYASQFKWGDAKAAFRRVVSTYPETASARLAMEQLKQIKQAGH